MVVDGSSEALQLIGEIRHLDEFMGELQQSRAGLEQRLFTHIDQFDAIASKGQILAIRHGNSVRVVGSAAADQSGSPDP